MTVGIAPHRKQASSIVKSVLDPRNSVIYVLIYKLSMEEARWGAVCPDAFAPVFMNGGKCSRLRAKPAHLVGHLPAASCIACRSALAALRCPAPSRP